MGGGLASSEGLVDDDEFRVVVVCCGLRVVEVEVLCVEPGEVDDETVKLVEVRADDIDVGIADTVKRLFAPRCVATGKWVGCDVVEVSSSILLMANTLSAFEQQSSPPSSLQHHSFSEHLLKAP